MSKTEKQSTKKVSENVTTKVTFAGHIFEIGERNIQELTFYLESSPSFEAVKKFIEEKFGDCKITKAKPTEFIQSTSESLIKKPRETEFVERDPPKDFIFPKLPELKSN